MFRETLWVTNWAIPLSCLSSVGECPVFTKSKFLRVLLPFLLIASVLTAGSSSAISIVPDNGFYLCSTGAYAGEYAESGVRYEISGGSVLSANACSDSVVITAGVTSIGTDAFSYSTLTSISIPSSVTSIGIDAFKNSSLASITFASQSALLTIGNYAFAYSSLANITIPDSVTTIGNYAFYFTGITSFTIPSGLTRIQRGVFSFTSLRSITIPDSVTTIETEAFWADSHMTSLTIGINVTSIDSDAFYATNSLTQYTYCGSLNQTTLNAAGLTGKTRIGCLPSSGFLTLKLCEPKNAIVFYNPSATFPQTPATPTLLETKYVSTGGSGWLNPSRVTLGYFVSPIDCSSTRNYFSGLPTTGTVSSTLLTNIENDSAYQANTGATYLEAGIVAGTTKYALISGTASVARQPSIFVVDYVSAATAPGAPGIANAVATGTTTATVGFTSPASNGGSTILSYTATSSPGGITATITQAGSGAISVRGLSPSTPYTFTVTATNSIGTSLASAASNSITTLGTGIAPLFTSASSYDGRFTVQIKDYDSAFTYAVTSSAGQASISATGLVTVTGLGMDQSVTVTVTTTRTGFASGSGSITGRSQVAPMLPGTKPVVIITDSSIMCTIGSYSATPTSSAFSLFVDGKHVSTIFSAVGEYLPDWIIPWATTSSITRTATLTSASWTMTDAYKGKEITCATLAYSKNAIGFTASQVLVAR